MSEEITEPTAQNPKRRTMLLGGAAAVLLGCCLLLVAAAIVLLADPFGLHIVSRLTGQYDAAATAMPENTRFYAGVNLLNLNAEEIGRITQPFIEAAGDADVESFQGAQEAFSDELETEFDINIETDVMPWLGQYLGFGIIDFSLDNFGEVDSVQWIVAAEARDRNAADEFLIELADSLPDSTGNDLNEQSYEGVTLYVMQSNDPQEQIAFGRSGSLVILGVNVRAVQAAIDAQSGDSLDETGDYRQIIGDLPPGRAVTIFTTGSGLSQLLDQSEGTAAVPINPSGLPLANFASAATTISIVEAGLQIDMVSYFDSEQLSPVQQSLLEAGGQPSETAGLFPDQTVAFANGQRLDLLWSAIREATGDEEGFDESMEAFAREFGFNPNTELFPYLDGEWGLGVIAGPSGLLAEEMNIPLGFTFVAATDRLLELADTIESIRSGLEDQFLIVNEVESEGINSYQVSLSEATGPAFHFGLEQDYLFITSSESALVETFSGGAALTENEQFQAVQSEFTRDINLAFYLNVRALLGTLREGRTGFDLLDFDESVQLFEPVEALALGNAYDNDIRRTQVIIFIETE